MTTALTQSKDCGGYSGMSTGSQNTPAAAGEATQAKGCLPTMHDSNTSECEFLKKESEDVMYGGHLLFLILCGLISFL